MLEAVLNRLLAHPHVIHTYTVSAAVPYSSEWLLDKDEGEDLNVFYALGAPHGAPSDCPPRPSQEDIEVEELLSGCSFQEIKEIFSCSPNGNGGIHSPLQRSGSCSGGEIQGGTALTLVLGANEHIPNVVGTCNFPQTMSKTRLSKSTNCLSNLHVGEPKQVDVLSLFFTRPCRECLVSALFPEGK